MPSKKPGTIFYAHGTSKHATGFPLRLEIRRFKESPLLLENESLNRSTVDYIFTSERRERERGCCGVIYGHKPNYLISLVAMPKIGGDRILEYTGVYLRCFGLESDYIATKVGRTIMFIANSLTGQDTRFLGINDMTTRVFWHNVILKGYLAATNLPR